MINSVNEMDDRIGLHKMRRPVIAGDAGIRTGQPKMGPLLRLLIFLAAGTLPFGISLADNTGVKKIKTFVSILPQAYFVERVGGPYVDVEVFVGPGQSPATFEPTGKQMSRLGRAMIYFQIGVPFEKSLLRKISGTFKNLCIVDTRYGIEPRFFRESGEAQVPDPHIWLDPKLVKIQASTICDTLCGIDPEHIAEFKKNLFSFQGDLDSIDARLRSTLAPLKGQRIYVFHPAFGYFADSYGLDQVAIEVEGKTPSAKQLTGLINKAKKEGVRVIFVQPQYSKIDAETIASAIGGIVVPVDPLAREYIRNLEDMAASIKKALQ